MYWHFLRGPTMREVDDYYQAVLPQLNKPANARKMPATPKGPISNLIVPVVDLGIRKVESHRARNRIFLCALALRGYRLKHGRLPDTLDQLRLNPRATADPYTGKPVIYRKDGDDFLLYSIGPDCRDDGGIPADENAEPLKGDIGIRAFRTLQPGSQYSRYYRKVPYMRPPKLPAGAPPLTK
jgi:type II secretory pathway pseudopilin PulG